MARPWRLRHKLLLGLALVVAIIATLLAGTVQGLSSYIATMKTTDSKLTELQMAEDLRKTIAGLVDPGVGKDEPAEEPARIRHRLVNASAALAKYVEQHHDTLRRGRDPDDGFQEACFIANFHESFADFGQALKNAGDLQLTIGESKSMVEDAKIKDAHAN